MGSGPWAWTGEGGSNLTILLTILLYYVIFDIAPLVLLLSFAVFLAVVFVQSSLKNPFRSPSPHKGKGAADGMDEL